MFLKSLTDIPNSYNFYIELRCYSKLDERTHNLPSVSEVAAILIDDDSNNVISTPHICIYTHCDRNQLVHCYYDCYDSLKYPLLFPTWTKWVALWYCKITLTTHFFSQSLYF